jgi:hypothetical protein
MRDQAKPAGSEPTPEPAIPAILAVFDKYQKSEFERVSLAFGATAPAAHAGAC